MDVAWVVTVLAVLIPVMYVVVTYNALVSLKNHIRDAWSNVDTELKRRYDLIPNLVSAVRGYAAHEQQVLERVTAMRNLCAASNGAVERQAADEAQLVDAIKQLMVVVERYPDLKADQHFLALQRELINTEDRIQAARRFFNGNVRDYRNKRETFPSVIVAKVFCFEDQPFFDVDPVVLEVPLLGTG